MQMSTGLNEAQIEKYGGSQIENMISKTVTHVETDSFVSQSDIIDFGWIIGVL